jgi:hypothetical protein
MAALGNDGIRETEDRLELPRRPWDSSRGGAVASASGARSTRETEQINSLRVRLGPVSHGVFARWTARYDQRGRLIAESSQGADGAAQDEERRREEAERERIARQRQREREERENAERAAAIARAAAAARERARRGNGNPNSNTFGALGVPAPGGGIFLVGSNPGTPAAGLGLEYGDVIVSINGVGVNTQQEYADAVHGSPDSMNFVIRNVRTGQLQEMSVHLAR